MGTGIIYCGRKKAPKMAIKSTRSLPSCVLSMRYLSLPHLCVIGVLQTLSTKPKMYILNRGAFVSFPFPRASLLN